jgi:hypothetical protein
LSFEAVLQEYLLFPYEYFFVQFFHAVVTVVNFVLRTTADEKMIRIKIG